MFFDPVVQSQKVLELWTKATQDQLARMAEMATQFETLSGQQSERTREAIDESARLLKSSVEYATKLGGEWRSISTELAAGLTNQAVSAASSAAATATAPKA
jgi:hypothetical protein